MLLSLLERSAQYGQLCPLLLRLLTDASHSLFLLTALPALDASQIAAGVYDNCNTGPSFFWRSFALTCHTNSPCCHQNKLLQRQRCLCHQLKIPPRKLRCTESSRGNLWCQTACLSRYRLIWSFCFAADHPETQRSSITSTSFFSSNFFTQPRSAFPALVAATLASSFS